MRLINPHILSTLLGILVKTWVEVAGRIKSSKLQYKCEVKRKFLTSVLILTTDSSI